MTVTVSLSDKAYQRLSLLKSHPDESDEEIIMAILDGEVDLEPISEETLLRATQARDDYKAGRTYSMEEVMAELGDSFD